MTNDLTSIEQLNLIELLDSFEDSSDIKIRTKSYSDGETLHFIKAIYCHNLVNTEYISQVLPKIYEIVKKENILNYELISNVVETNKIDKQKNVLNQIEEGLFSGNLVILSSFLNDIFLIPVANLAKRSPEESNIETSVRGPKDGFVENISDNMGLIRQRLKTSSLKSIEFFIGERSKTKVILLYMDDILNPIILSTVKERLHSLKLDIVVSSYEIEELLYDHSFSIFPLMDHTGRPDYVVQSVNQGRFGILVDGNPTCLIGPTSINQLLYSPEDIHGSFFYANLVRYLRMLALLTTILLPGFYLALITYHLDQVPYPYIATIAVSRLGLPLSSTIETFIMLAFFELFKEAGVRLPKAVGQTVAVLGGLFIGDAAIRAGLTSPTMLVVIAITVISGYTLVNQNIAGNIVILRVFVLICSTMLGLLGFFSALFLVLTHVASLTSFGQPYALTATKPNKVDIMAMIFRLPQKFLKKRHQALNPIDDTRKKE